MKTDQITIRVPEDLKQVLEDHAKAAKVSISAYIRQELNRSFKEKDSNLEERISKIEKVNPLLELQQKHNRFVNAISYLVSIDKKLPIDECLLKILELEKAYFNINDLNTKTRSDIEEIVHKIYEGLLEHFKLSKKGKIALLAFMVAYLANNSKEEYFNPYLHSIKLMEELRS